MVMVIVLLLLRSNCKGILVMVIVSFFHPRLERVCESQQGALSALKKTSRERKILLVSVKFVSAILGPEMAAPILWTPGKNAFFLQENLHP